MTKARPFVAVAALALAGGGVYAAAEMKTREPAKPIHVELMPNELQWSAGPPALPPGAQMMVLEGNPAAKGIFAMRLKLPAGYRVAPHTHPRQERVTVLAGHFRLGHGRTFDESRMKDLEPGSFISLPPGMEHFASASEETIIQLNSEGPWEINYINPKDDPRRAGAAGR